MKTKEVAKLLGKCEETIKRNAKKIGKVMSKAGTEWTDEEIELLRKQLEENKNVVHSEKRRKKISDTLKKRGTFSELFLQENPNFDGILATEAAKKLGYKNNLTICQTYKDLIKYVFYKNVKLSYLTKEDFEKCKKRHSGTSIPEKEIADFLEQYVEIERNTRKVINPLELDIYIPSKKVAVEFNGLYWHSKYDKNYHYCKMKECEKAGIRCIQIFEDEWMEKQDIVKSILLSAIGVYERKIFARKCKVKEIETKIANQFLDENHINGSVKTATKAYGLFYNDELLQVITVGVNRFTKERKLELLRMATKKNCQVVGGFSKLLKDSGIAEIESYVDRRIYNGSGYASSGWTVIGESVPSYFYTNFEVRKNRMSFMKCKLPPVEGIEGGGTELERATKLGWYRIYDCGTIKLKWIK